jgi:hypothetical protein
MIFLNNSLFSIAQPEAERKPHLHAQTKNSGKNFALNEKLVRPLKTQGMAQATVK